MEGKGAGTRASQSRSESNKYTDANDKLGNIIPLLPTVLFGEKVPEKDDLNQRSCNSSSSCKWRDSFRYPAGTIHQYV